MAIAVTLYDFSKKKNSTKRPSSEGVSVNMNLKDDTSIFRPRLELALSTATSNPLSYNYAYIADFGRYYFIADWTWERGVWTGIFTEDVLATFKTEIGNSTLYVLRSAAKANRYITDGFYPSSTKITTKKQELTLEEGWVSSPSAGNGSYVIGVVNNITDVNGSVCYYVLTGAQMAAFRAYMLSSIAAWDDITDFSGDVAKAFIDPFQYVVSCMWFPTGVPVSAKNTTIAFGFWQSTLTASYLSQFTREYPFTLTRPTRDAPLSTYPYLHKSPWAHYYLYLQPWGLIELDGTAIAATGISCKITHDFVTGKSILVVRSKQTDDILFSGEAQVGVSMQLSNVGIDFKGMTSLSGLKNTALNSAVAAIAGGANSFNASNILSSAVAANSEAQSTGSNSGMAAVSMGGTAVLYAQFYEPVDFDESDNGSPLCENVKISTVAGFNKVENGSLALAGTADERDAVRNYLEGGFYYE